MSGIARLLRWAPCLWAISRLANGSGQAPRSQILNSQSGPQHPSGPSDLLQTISFTARTVVKHSPVVRPSLAARPPATETQAAPDTRGSANTWHWRSFLRHRQPQVHDGWQWDHPPIFPISWGMKGLSIAAKIISQVRGVCFGRPLPTELKKVILLTVQRSKRSPRELKEVDVRLVCHAWDEILRKGFWKKRWLNLRPRNSQWPLIAERLQALARNADVIKNVKLDGVLTDILPLSLEEALRRCPQLANIALCRIERIKIGRLDSLTEILLKQILLHHQQNIRHFGFRLEDTPLFVGRRSLFANSILRLPQVRRITVDISNSDEALYLEDLHGNSAGLVSYFIAELVGREGRENEAQIELRLFCMPNSAEAPRRPQITSEHTDLASQIFEFTRTLLESLPGIIVVCSFQGPLTSQIDHNFHVIRAWARGKNVSLLDSPTSRIEPLEAA
ncbi:uncharacterized protein UTRI_01129_B [Ustilago trichophora]|uniref:F-box domain-containing protein n=1 Tax=Ustilago trichophora TaxID=86804 RepID=A0A5C3DWS4_9BASI|nr:uncharacterized protein UTRI_01129_B [Ustilago trichophora]